MLNIQIIPKISAFLVFSCIIFSVNASIENESVIRNLIIPRGNYTQYRVSGFGYGDSSLESSISQVDIEFSFKTNKNARPNNITDKVLFDIMIFQQKADYLCYVEAVHSLYFEKVKKDCDFRQNKTIFKSQISDLSPPDDTILNHDQRAKEYFFVIDNTEWPEALDDPSWTSPTQVIDKSKNVYLEMITTVTYKANDSYVFWTFIFTVILVILGFGLFLSVACYCRQTWKYNMYSKDRRAIKLELMKIKDSEYTNFLLQEKEMLDEKNEQQIGGSDLHFRNINETVDLEDEEEELDNDQNY